MLTLDGQKYLVGKNASDGFAKLNVSPEFHGGPTWKVLLVWAFYQAMKHRTGNELVLDKLGLGLPYSQHRKPLIEKIKSMQEFSFQVDGRDYLVTAKETTVLPQGAAIIANFENTEEAVGILDIGYYTLDMVLLRDQRIVRDKSRSTNDGIHLLAEEARKMIRAQFPEVLEVPDAAVMRFLSKGGLKISGVYHDCASVVEQLLAVHAQKIIARAKTAWETDLPLMEATYLVGGGAALLAQHFNGGLHSIRVIEDPEFGNALGYMKYLNA